MAMQMLPLDWPGNFWAHWAIFAVVILVFVLLMVMFFIWLERRAMAVMQARLGPNRAGPFGLFQPAADALKILIKEDIVPARSDKLVHWLAPVVAFVPAMLIFAVVPFWGGALLADLNIGILYVVAISSVTVVGSSWPAGAPTINIPRWALCARWPRWSATRYRWSYPWSALYY